MMTDHKPNKCYYKPERTKDRYFNAKTAAQAYCYARSRSNITQEDFIKEVNKRCGWEGSEGDADFRRKVQDVMDALEKLAEELLKLFGPGFFAKVLGKVYKALPEPIRKALERWAVGKAKEIGRIISDSLDKLKRLPPP